MSAITETRASERLLDRINDRSARIGVIGLGYVGLPLAASAGRAGFDIVGFDIDPDKAARLNDAESYIDAVSSEDLARLIKAGRFVATADFSRLGECDVIVICVPTPLTRQREPDLSYIERTAQAIAPTLRRQQLVVLESTSYPGTTREVMKPILEATGLKSGVDFYIGFSPEREDPGNQHFATATIPKVVAGEGPDAAKAVEAFYAAVVQKVVPVSTVDTAEAVKITENVFRAVNIALVNELKMVFDRMGIDVWEVIEAAKTKPFGFMPFYPGPGLGGHCIPIDPFYLTWLARKHGLTTRFIELAGEINTLMPQYVVDQVSQSLNDVGKPIRGSKICLLGVAYKKDVDDPRESPAFRLMELLAERGAQLSYHDPHIPMLPKTRHFKLPELVSHTLTDSFLAQQDAAVIVTDHSAFDYDFVVQHARLVIDTRNATRNVKHGREKIHKA